jgi:hypothetical protein
MKTAYSLIKSFENQPGLETAFAPSKSRSSLKFSLYPEGIPLGALTQILGAGSTEAILRLFSEYPEEKMAWVEERFTAYPPGFVQGGANLNGLLFVESGEHFAWALTQILRSQLFKVVVAASALRGDGVELRLKRLQLAAEHSQSALILAAECEGPLWPLRLRLQARQEEGRLILTQREDSIQIKEAIS